MSKKFAFHLRGGVRFQKPLIFGEIFMHLERVRNVCIWVHG